ncbi:MAG: metallophosphoesterase [Lentisphaeria bacterium]|nr:metallophosphoesterase [Lentisphaeria bacterium]NQZ67578.1 metallophosphoesterase [Lentisphaeria bacterium]
MDSWTFAVVADMHVGTPRSWRFDPAAREQWQTARQQIVDLTPEYLLVAGDMTRDGLTHRFELEEMKEDLDALPFPYLITPGNHDVGDKFNLRCKARICRQNLDLYNSVFPGSEYSVVHRNVRFSGFNSQLIASDLAEEAELWAWMESQKADPDVDHHVWMTHVPLCLYQFADDNHEPIGWNWYFSLDEPSRSRIVNALKATDASLLLTGHTHNRRELLHEGIRFQSLPATSFPIPFDFDGEFSTDLGFMLYTVSADSLESEFIPLAKKSTLKGYGTTDYVAPEDRDYSVVEEQPPLDITEQMYPL